MAIKIAKFFHDLGTLMIIDDFQDFGKFSFDDHKSPFHHWQLGLILKQLSLYAAQALTLQQAIQKTNQELKSKQHNFYTNIIQNNYQKLNEKLESFFNIID